MTLAHAGHATDGFPATALLPAVLFWAYLAAALRLRDPDGPGWAHGRTASFGLGTLLVALGLLRPADDFVGHMWQHLLIGMLAPLALVLGAPVTLVLRTLDRRAGRRLVHVLRHPVARVLGHPATGLLLTAGGLWLLYLTPLYRATLDNPALHTLVQAHFLLSGCLFAWSIAGPDPGPHRPRVPVRLVVLGVGVAAHATIAQLLYAGVLVDVPAGAAELRAGATLMYYLGDLAEIALALALLATWRPERPARRPADRSATGPAPARA
ncbi:cytochrome C oxidase assembly protein [Micromonospora sp. WMMA1996]|uniref:cytochrome c oxidase assembly protein n=1 Tax=Micromonospora sp. WMMA1996 TaxID=2039878 RepID=UPI000BF6C4C4|nr:cytochrome c oxidase assembly protein [Micromonospora sp. WMMA1996]PGH46563.1 cytochrome C oxidase assembly protein [Micromonospora sp. WMMA1996]